MFSKLVVGVVPDAAPEIVDTSVRFFTFDIFMVLFTILIAVGVYRLMKAPKKNLFALGFGGTCLILFLVVDALMILNWMGIDANKFF